MLCYFWLEQLLPDRELSKFGYFKFSVPRCKDANCNTLMDSEDPHPAMEVTAHGSFSSLVFSQRHSQVEGLVPSFRTFHGLLSYVLLPTAASFEITVVCPEKEMHMQTFLGGYPEPSKSTFGQK